MKVNTAICVHTGNKEHVKWWNNIGRKLVKSEFITKVIDGTTKEVTGYVFAIKGLLKRYVERKNNSFIRDQQVVYFTKN